MKHAILAILATVSAVFAISAQADVIGVHTFSQHATKQYNRVYEEGVVEHIDYNNRNFGAYYIADNGLTVGAYRNSYRRDTVYVGYTAQTRAYGPFRLAATAALATGYDNLIGYGKLRPMVMPSLVVDTGLGVNVRYTVAPSWQKGSTGLFQHLSFEVKL